MGYGGFNAAGPGGFGAAAPNFSPGGVVAGGFLSPGRNSQETQDDKKRGGSRNSTLRPVTLKQLHDAIQPLPVLLFNLRYSKLNYRMLQEK